MSEDRIIDRQTVRTCTPALPAGAATLWAVAGMSMLGIVLPPDPAGALAIFGAGVIYLLLARWRDLGRAWLEGIGFMSVVFTALTASMLFLLPIERVPDAAIAVVRALWGLLGFETYPAGDGVVRVALSSGWVDVSVSPEKLGVVPIATLALWTLYATARVRGAGVMRSTIAGVAAGAVLGVGAAIRLLVIFAFDAHVNWLHGYMLPWVEALTFLPVAGAVALTHRALILRPSANASAERRTPRNDLPGTSLLWAATAALLAGVTLTYMPIGERVGGAVVIDEAHSDWAWAADEFGRDSFGQRAVYTYGSARQYLEHFWDVRVSMQEDLRDALTDDVSVLVLKMPTRPYTAQEMDAVEDFVRAGGGLLMIGDHTNLFGSSTYLNPLAQRFGMYFRNDSQFEVQTGNPTSLDLSAVQRGMLHLRGWSEATDVDFLTGCTLVAPPGAGVINGLRMASEPGDYAHVNFFGNIRAERDERFGVFTQLAAVSHGRGRVLAFTDSTLFSDFCVWSDGRAEMLLRLIDRLDRDRGPLVNATANFSEAVRVPLWLAAVLLGVWSVAQRWYAGPAVLIAAAGGALLAAPSARTDWPEPREPVPHVVVHHQLGGATYPGFLDQGLEFLADPTAFDQFFLSLARNGHVPTDDRSVLPTGGDRGMDVVILPTPRLVEDDRLIERVRSGGRLLLVVESGNPAQRTSTERFLDKVGVGHSAVAVPTPRWPQAIGVEEDPMVNDAPETVARLLLPAAEERITLRGCGVWIQRLGVGEGVLTLVDGATALSRRGQGITFSVPNERERAIADLCIAAQRVALGLGNAWSELESAGDEADNAWNAYHAEQDSIARDAEMARAAAEAAEREALDGGADPFAPFPRFEKK